jgi:hypothetical protein
MNQTAVIVIALVVVCALAVVALLLWSRWRTRNLKQRFGPEYRHTVDEVGDRRQAENELAAREKRVVELELHELSADERRDFARRWREIQVGFVDRPSEAITAADRLVTEAMQSRGYPVADYRRRQEDLSVEYPVQVAAYRDALRVAHRNRRGEASTEELRQAMVWYRDLFDHLLGAPHEARRPHQPHRLRKVAS